MWQQCSTREAKHFKMRTASRTNSIIDYLAVVSKLYVAIHILQCLMHHYREVNVQLKLGFYSAAFIGSFHLFGAVVRCVNISVFHSQAVYLYIPNCRFVQNDCTWLHSSLKWLRLAHVSLCQCLQFSSGEGIVTKNCTFPLPPMGLAFFLVCCTTCQFAVALQPKLGRKERNRPLSPCREDSVCCLSYRCGAVTGEVEQAVEGH